MAHGKHHPVDPSDEAPFNVFLHQYFESSTQDQIDLLTCPKNITGLLFFANNHMSTLTNLQIEHLTKKKKEIQGTTGNLSNLLYF